MKNKYFLLRHGQTIYQTKKKNVLYPWPEGKSVFLTRKGKKQIEKAANFLKKKKIDFIFSSDLNRTKQSAEIVGKKLGLKVYFDRRLRELNFGKFHSGPKEKYNRLFSKKIERFYKKPPGGENWNELKKRILDFLAEVEKKHKNKNILIVSHGDPLWFLAGIIKGARTNKDFLKKKFLKLYPKVGEVICLDS